MLLLFRSMTYHFLFCSDKIYNWFSSNAAAAAALKLVILEVFKLEAPLAPFPFPLKLPLFLENDCRLWDGLILGTYMDVGCWLEFAPVNMAIRVVEFSNWGIKLERFLPKNHHTQRKFWILRIRLTGASVACKNQSF